MSSTSVFCFATSRTQAGQIVDRLKAASFSSNAISELFSDAPPSRELVEVKHVKGPEGAVIGTGIGGLLGWFAGIGVVALPGFGPFIDGNPALAVLCGVTMGAVVGGLAGGWVGMGIPAREARRDEDKLRSENIRISVHAENPSEITQAEVIFAYAGGQGICTAPEAADYEDNRATEIITYPLARVKKPAVQA